LEVVRVFASFRLATLDGNNAVSDYLLCPLCRIWLALRLFVLDFIITMAIVVYGYFFFPDTPETTTAFYLTEEERALCVSRLPPNKKEAHVTWSSLKATMKRAVLGWRFWSFSSLFMISSMLEAFGIFSIMPLWCKGLRRDDGSAYFTTEQINYYPTGITAMSIVGTVGATLCTSSSPDSALYLL
jgi:ACS family pantothenate transporter-like MFS transporter